jgi:thiamine pyrophosphate-dependent acetolactate synthase large subunit-like protein
VLRLGAQPGAVAERVVVDDVDLLPQALAAWEVGEVFTSIEYELAIDLDQPASDHLEPVRIEPELQASTLARDMADVQTLLLAGPGVVRHGALAGLHEVARRLGAGVVNTWGAKGVYRWDSPFHFGTAGLQERDAELAGLGSAELVITTGLDPHEMPTESWARGPVLDVDPRVLTALTYQWEESSRALARPALYERLSSALAPLYASDAAPLSPARAASDLGAARPDGGVICADPGPAGLWVARALPTTEPASVIVPALEAHGFALAAAITTALEQRPAIAVLADPVDPTTAELLALAEHWGTDLVLEVWGSDAAPRSPAARADELTRALHHPGVSVLATAVDLDLTEVLVEAAGPVVAWRDRPSPPSGNGQR